MSRQASSRHQTSGKKTAHSTGALKTVLTFDIINSLMLIFLSRMKPDAVAAAEIASHFVPP